MTARLFHLPPSPNERRMRRDDNLANQGRMFDWHPHQSDPCAVCASDEHPTDHCPHGTPLDLFTTNHERDTPT